MSRLFGWLQQREQRLFIWVNHGIRHRALDLILSQITHLGSATFTIMITVLAGLLGEGAIRLTAIQAFIALAVSHIPVAIIKKRYPRLRPYLVLPETRTGENPLTDHSFPSGHTTAIFSIVIPFVILLPALGLWLLPLAFTVAVSRIYLGLHYPSDCAAGCLIGSVSGLAAVAFVG
jgi:undecaprenyl-diphosphatase